MPGEFIFWFEKVITDDGILRWQVMATTETKENKMEIVYPGEQFFLGLTRMLTERTKINIAMVSQHSGDIAFFATYADLGIVPQTLNHPFYHTSVFADFLGSLLVRQNLDLFSARIMEDKFYDANVREYNHKNFGMRTTGNDALMFQCHFSLIFQLVNEQLNREIEQEVAKITLACPKKVKRGSEEDNGSVISYCDNTNIRIIVPKKNNDKCHGFKTAIEMILNFYKITGKDVFIANNLFNWEVEIKNK